jgi:peptidoglycan/LPS O-acetylase OafA/YrhL
MHSTQPLGDLYKPHIDGLRALAITSVVIYHAFPEFLSGGFMGVDVFFAISGYLISGIIFRQLAAGTFSFADFYTRRIRRIFPALLVVFAAVCITGWIGMSAAEFKQLGKHMAAGAGFVENLILWREAGYFDTASELKPLMHLWSLAIEEQYYLLYPLLVVTIWRNDWDLLLIIIVLIAYSFF